MIMGMKCRALWILLLGMVVGCADGDGSDVSGGSSPLSSDAESPFSSVELDSTNPFPSNPVVLNEPDSSAEGGDSSSDMSAGDGDSQEGMDSETSPQDSVNPDTDIFSPEEPDSLDTLAGDAEEEADDSQGVDDVQDASDVLDSGPDTFPGDGESGDGDSSSDGDGEEGGEDAGTEESGLSWVTGTYTFINQSNASDAHCEDLISEALVGLGFVVGDERGPQPEDRFFVGEKILVWLDQTGFVGKMNGLWRLNGAAGNGLNFSVRDGDRVLNFLVVGEHGDGAFPPGYPGSEHIEFPNTTPEPNDDPACGDSDWCNQYAHDEAASITNPLIPWWSSCNTGQVGWDKLYEPIEEETVEGGIRLLWEAPLVKEADGDGTWNSDACHQDWLFSDGIRRPVFLQVGYELFGSASHVDRIVRFRNPEGNPAFTGPMSVIGGFVLTGWPTPHPMKRLDQWMKPVSMGFFDSHSGLDLLAGVWNFYKAAISSGDLVFAWLDQPIGLSAFPTDVPGRTVVLSHEGESDNADVGLCLCIVHGALEMGGGLLHGGISLPIEGGTESVEARRRLSLPGEEIYPKSFFYDAVTDFLHATGDGQADGWAAATGFHDVGHMLYGPYTTQWCGFQGEADFFMLVDNNTSDDLVLVVLDVYDSTTDTVLGSRSVTRQEFLATSAFQSFKVPFDATGFAGHTLEARAYWTDNSLVKINSVTVTLFAN